MAQQNAFWATTFVPWVQFPPQSARPDYNYYTSRYTNVATKLYSGLTLWEIVAIILVLVLFLIIVVLILLCLYHCICGRGGRGSQNNNNSNNSWCPCDCWSWLCCGCSWCQPYQPYRRRPPPATVVEQGPCEKGYVGGATRYNGKSLETRSTHSYGDIDRVVVIKEQIKERPSSDARRPVVHRQQLLTSGYDNDAYSQSGRLATTDTNDRDDVAVVHRYDDDIESSYNQRPTAIAHLSVDRAGYGGNGDYSGGSDFGNGYHSAAYDVVTSGGTVRYPSLHSLR